MHKKEIICIVCPRGCHLMVTKDESAQWGYIITGNDLVSSKSASI